ncbi:MAG: hypothetical protein AB1730_04935 [Myxococcota bacterium]
MVSAALVAALVASSALADDVAPPHPIARDGVWLQVAPLDVSWSFEAVDALSFLPWLPVTFGADLGLLQFGVGVGVRPLVRDVMILTSPVLRRQFATLSPRLGGLVEARLHAGILPRSGLAVGGGFGFGLEIFLFDWLSLSPTAGVDILAGATGGSRSSVGVVVSGRVALNAVF